MRLVIVLLALTTVSPCGMQAPDCNHGRHCKKPAVCTFLENPPGSGTGEWFCVTPAPEMLQ
jgi:hypothetical protein